jgi:hypothetical protein
MVSGTGASVRVSRQSSMSDFKLPMTELLNEKLVESEVEPLLPIEKKLLGWCLGIGLLIAFIAVKTSVI